MTILESALFPAAILMLLSLLYRFLKETGGLDAILSYLSVFSSLPF